MLNQTSPSPSPIKRSQSRPAPESDGDEDEDEDEETLQLKLQELQAKLKLKKLQSAKAKGAKEPDFSAAKKRTEELYSMTSSNSSRITAPQTGGVRDENVQPTAHSYPEVPASPVRRPQASQQVQTSPRRVQLGIDKGLKATDVSLKRAPSLYKRQDGQGGQQSSRHGTAWGSGTDGGQLGEPMRPMSFSERLASARSKETMNAEKQQRVRKARTTTFGIGREEMENYKKDSTEIPEEPDKPPSFTREEVLAKSHREGGSLKRGNTVSSLHSKPGDAEASEQKSASFDAYSGLHLSRRFLPHTVLARHLSGKKIVNIKDMLRQVKAPDFQLPDVEQDIVAMGIIAKKSEPRSHKPATAKNGEKPEERGKYMVMTLADLDYDLDLFLFNSGFQRFWKLTEGTVVAILNPSIMAPRPGRHDTGRFSLIINSDEDTIIEIGTARDLGYCESVKRYGEQCGAWVNKKRTKFCEFHSNEAVKKMKASRVEMNTNGFGSRRLNSRDMYKKTPDTKTGGTYDWESKSNYFVSRSMSASDLIDGKDKAADKREREENLRRRLEAQEKERGLMQKLGRAGSGAGKEYMQRSGSKQPYKEGVGSSQQEDDIMETHRATLKSFDLQRRERTIELGPLKRKRADSSQEGLLTGTKMSSSSTSLGWGSGLKDKLARMKEGEKLRPTPDTGQAPVQKKTRFVTDKGIREAGRESLGMDLSGRQVTLDDDDDDELIIVK